MAGQDISLGKKRGRPAIGAGVQINTVLRPEMVAALDAWIAEQPEPRPNRTDAIRRVLAEALQIKGSNPLLGGPGSDLYEQISLSLKRFKMWFSSEWESKQRTNIESSELDKLQKIYPEVPLYKLRYMIEVMRFSEPTGNEFATWVSEDRRL